MSEDLTDEDDSLEVFQLDRRDKATEAASANGCSDVRRPDVLDI